MSSHASHATSVKAVSVTGRSNVKNEISKKTNNNNKFCVLDDDDMAVVAVSANIALTTPKKVSWASIAATMPVVGAVDAPRKVARVKMSTGLMANLPPKNLMHSWGDDEYWSDDDE